MLQNLLFFGIGGILAASCFMAPLLLASYPRPMRSALIVVLYGVVLGGIFLFSDAKSAFAAMELALFFTVLAKLLAIHFNIVQTAAYPKHRRCY